MDKKKLFTLSLKFKRHHLQFEYDEKANYVVIGKTKNVKKKIIQAVLLIAISVPIIVAIASFNIPFKKLLVLVLFAPIAYGLMDIFKYLKLANKNKYRKIITPDSFKIESPEGLKTYHKDMVENIHIEVKRDSDLEGEGALIIELQGGERVHLLSLKDKKTGKLKSDLEYLKVFLEESMAMEKAPLQEQ